jgi:hypothetical protein
MALSYRSGMILLQVEANMCQNLLVFPSSFGLYRQVRMGRRPSAAETKIHEEAERKDKSPSDNLFRAKPRTGAGRARRSGQGPDLNNAFLHNRNTVK